MATVTQGTGSYCPFELADTLYHIHNQLTTDLLLNSLLQPAAAAPQVVLASSLLEQYVATAYAKMSTANTDILFNTSSMVDASLLPLAPLRQAAATGQQHKARVTL